MKRRTFLIFSFKGFVSSLLASLFGFSVVLLIFFGGEKEETVSVAASAKDIQTVIIDAGHGGEDGGTQSIDGTLEKDINLQISLKLEKMLGLMGYKTVLLRNKDELIYSEGCSTMREKKVSDQRNRLEIVRQHPDCIYVSIHQNYFTEEKYCGAQVFYSQNNEYSAELAQSIQSSIVGLVQTDNSRKIKKSGSEIFMLRNVEVPAVMVECGFMSNKNESELLKSDDYQKKIVLAVAKGISDYLLLDREEI